MGSHLCDYLVQRGDHVRITSCNKVALMSQCLLRVSCGACSERSRHGQSMSSPWPVGIMYVCLAHMQVICIDNFFTGTRENVAHLLEKANFELIRHDVVNAILLEVDEIYHMACPASPVHYKYVSTHILGVSAIFMGIIRVRALWKAFTRGLSAICICSLTSGAHPFARVGIKHIDTAVRLLTVHCKYAMDRC